MEPGVSESVAIEHPAVTNTSSEVIRSGSHLTVEVRRDLNLPAHDVEALESLIDQCPRVGVFISKAWLGGFFAEPPDGCVPALALIREGALLRGVAPLAIREAPARTYVRLLGGGHGSDRVDLLVHRGFEASCSDELLAWLIKSLAPKGLIFELRDVPADSCLWGAIHRAGAEQRLQLALQPSEIHTLPYLPLTGSDAERGLEAWPASKRRSLEKHRRMLERRCRLQIDLLDDSADVSAAFECLVRFLHVRWDGRGEGSVLDSPRALRFHKRAMLSLLDEGRLRMIRLSADMRTIAVFYGIASRTWWGYYLSGYDREWAGRIHLGQLTLAAALEIATREGATEFDFLKGADRVKYVWPVLERATIDADLYSQGSGAQLQRAARATRDATAALAKSARHLFLRS